MPSRQGSPNYLPSKQARQDLLRGLRERADEGDSVAAFGVLVIDHLYRSTKQTKVENAL